MDTLKELLSHLSDAKLLHTSPLSDLKPIFGIDGDSFISSLIQEDFYSQVLGGPNFTLKAHLSFSLQKFKEKEITPVFFFSGIPLRAETSTIAKRYKRSQKLWEKINKNQSLDIERILAKQEFSTLENFREIFETVRNNGGEVMKCPSYAGFQLAHLDKSLCGVMGGVDLLSFGIGKVVVRTDFETNLYEYVLADEVWKYLKVPMRKFTEALVAKGVWTGRKVIRQPILEVFSGMQVGEKDLREVERFAGLIESEFYLCRDTEKLHFKPITEIQALVPVKTPEHLYFALCLLPLSSGLISAFVKKIEVMIPPAADSLKYKTLVSKYKPIMRKLYSILNALFDTTTPGSLKGIKTYYWYDEIQPFQLDFEQVKELGLDQVLGKFEEAAVEVDLQAAAKFHIHLWQEHKDVLVSIKLSTDTHKIKSLDSLKLKVFLKIFHSIGFITPSFDPTLFEFVLTLPQSPFNRQIFLLLELLKLGLLDWKPMTLIKLPESVLKKIAPDNSDLARLVSRVCSLLPATLSSDTWTSSVDYDLAQFYSMVNYISKVHQYLAEVFLLEEFVSGRLEISIKSVTEFLGQLQCVPLNSVVIGILVKKVLEGKKIGEINKEIPQAIDIGGDLERAWLFWKEFMSVVWLLTKESDDVRGVIEQAGRLFKSTLIGAGIHVI